MRRSVRGAARGAAFGLATVLRIKSLGFFIPYRFAASVRVGGYPALEPLFSAAQPRADEVLGWVESFAADLERIKDGPGPARFDQHWFPALDAAAAYAVVRATRPRRILEIGSGHSTRFLARAVTDGGLATELVAVDPAPRASLAGLPIRHLPRVLEPEDDAIAAALEAGDILFVDSSHIAMPGTDLDRIVGDLMPRLRPGVLLHLHDIFLPDPYPDHWGWRGYNESVVAAALVASGGFDIVFSSRWTRTRRPPQSGVIARLPRRPESLESSLWLRKL